jgi:hydroxyacylglutathione hydrolase
MLTVTPIPSFTDNYIWMLRNEKNQAVVVDPGDAQVIINALDQHQLNLAAILITHHHYDHTDGVKELREKYSIPVYGPTDSKFNGISEELNDGDSVEVLGHSFKIKSIPGHTLDHISYLYDDPSSPQIFCGDTLFLAGCGRVFEGTMEQMLSAMQYIKTLDKKTKVYCTHEYSLSNLAFAQTVEPDNIDIKDKIVQCQKLREQNLPTLPNTIENELLINPFLRCDVLSVKQQASVYATLPLDSELEVFSTIRQWKNVF